MKIAAKLASALLGILGSSWRPSREKFKRPANVRKGLKLLRLLCAAVLHPAPDSASFPARRRIPASTADKFHRTVARFPGRSEEHTSELQSPYVISYAVFC